MAELNSSSSIIRHVRFRAGSNDDRENPSLPHKIVVPGGERRRVVNGVGVQNEPDDTRGILDLELRRR